jgi:uncharacterized RDD family membrane protein YckC
LGSALMAKRPVALLDTVREVYTPEGVALRLPAAGPVPRAMAWLIDAGIRYALLAMVSTILAMTGEAGAGVYLIVLFVVFWGYPVLFEVLMDGQTPGKRAMALRVIAADGAPVGWLASFARNLLRTVDFLPFGYALGLIVGYADPWGRRLGDMVAKTVVIHAPREPSSALARLEGAYPPAMPLQPQEQAAVIAFAERARLLTPGRQEELANIAAPIVGSGGGLGVRRLQGVANWLLGRT